MTSIDLVFPAIAIVAVLAVMLSIFGKVQGKYHFLQYVYFLRAPIGASLLMIFFPILLLLEPADQFVRNWFDLDFVGMAVVTFLSLLLAWVVMNKFFVNYYLTAPRNHLVLSRERQKEAKKHDDYKNTEFPILNKRLGPFSVRLCLFSLLAIPLVTACFIQSSFGAPKKLGAVAIGLIGAFSLWAIWQIWIQTELMGYVQRDLGKERRNIRQKLKKYLEIWTSPEFVDALIQGYDRQDELIERVRLSAWLFFVITFATYILAYFFLSPADFPNWTERVPALGYILLLLILLVWLLPTITLFLDKFRIPTLTSILLISFIITKLSGSDYYYELIEPGAETVGAKVPTVATSFQSWRNRHKERDRAIIITASGGGISAAYWTSLVVTELERALHSVFSSSVLLISSTSGGSVGAMHIVAQYDSEGLGPDNLADIVKDAGSPSLGATAWGLIFPDFWRSLLGYSPLADRAWAQEQIWEHYLGKSESGGPITMNSWRRGIEEGWRPVVIFNATIAETGEQLFISPIDLSPNSQISKCSDEPAKEEAPKPRGLVDLYPGADIKVTTAARLSAAFPLITPTARPKFTFDCMWVPFHIGDGGYYDNYGTQAAIRYLEQLLPIVDGKLKRILVLQIRASDTKVQLDARTTTSAVSDVFGPLITMYNVRSTSQVVNNDLMLKMQKSRWSEKPESSISIESMVVSLDQESPLSWYLSREEKCDILAAWNRIRVDRTKIVSEFLGVPFSGNLPPLKALEDCE